MNETKNQAISVQRKINISNVEKNIKTSLIRSKIFQKYNDWDKN